MDNQSRGRMHGLSSNNRGRLIAGGVAAAILYMGIFMMPGQMKMNLLYLLGSMMLRERVMIYTPGAMIHAMMSVAFAGPRGYLPGV